MNTMHPEKQTQESIGILKFEDFSMLTEQEIKDLNRAIIEAANLADTNIEVLLPNDFNKDVREKIREHAFDMYRKISNGDEFTTIESFFIEYMHLKRKNDIDKASEHHNAQIIQLAEHQQQHQEEISTQAQQQFG